VEGKLAEQNISDGSWAKSRVKVPKTGSVIAS
jgi:hypothetical protein